MPVLHRGGSWRRVDPARERVGPGSGAGQVLLARTVTLETGPTGRPVSGAIAGTAAALAGAAAWVGAVGVRVATVAPAQARPQLLDALAGAGAEVC